MVTNMSAVQEAEFDVPQLVQEAHDRLVSEGSGALSVGGLVKIKERFKDKKDVAVVCGRNIDLEVFKKIIA